MGLPSGTLWADRNLGAESPQDIGLLYSWGNTQGHSATSGYEFAGYDEEEESFTPPYSDTEGAELVEDSITKTSHDPAWVETDHELCLPTATQIAELRENCTASYNEESNLITLTSNINGNSIVLPVGLGEDDVIRTDLADFMSGDLSENENVRAWTLHFAIADGIIDEWMRDSQYCCLGFQIRPVAATDNL